ncbi:NADPH-dependent FMN reductase [Ferruginibacter albus]|uniref:NADPH-dependent FMN reductase n=1 Tax=Ferruginibacter albus TaxID=2875540 RepID=UPI001CC50EE8|nr:NAD(P)H-dependent oxidoreductase [Ferruginibacter albus]UAY53591.1 NAD(P)H-dependent oxidoreductase [Ferruginibacter albus]
MAHIAIISSSVRTGRKSHRVALYFKNYLEENKIATAEIIDLNEYQFPIFDERLQYTPNPSPKLLEYAGKIKAANGVIIVTPEYNGGYPASIKNAIDVLYEEWYRKPLVIATVSNGPFGGTQVITSLHFSLWKIRALMAPAMFPVPNIEKSFDENGVALDKEKTDKRAATFISELMWCVEAKNKMS